jgi:hypothetical protein
MLESAISPSQGLRIWPLNYAMDIIRLYSPIIVKNKSRGSRRLSDSQKREVFFETFNSRLAELENRRLPDSPSRRVFFRLRISPRSRSQNRNASKCRVRDQFRTGLCKNLGKSASLPCSFNLDHHLLLAFQNPYAISRKENWKHLEKTSEDYIKYSHISIYSAIPTRVHIHWLPKNRY